MNRLLRWIFSRKEITDYLPLRGSPRRQRTALSICGCTGIGRFDSLSRRLSSTELSVGGSHQRRQSSLSPALIDSLR
ncbi:hypothetical protein F2Q70_00015755 [Brassica cretica]|uniref:Uncharacterized protein n=1 Tax=Brassica cretica TaxID=69181 RepID=A0A8S9I4A3_BRACR|nr:hypothetical protein F2Q70_00015755 [Brassica cretica]